MVYLQRIFESQLKEIPSLILQKLIDQKLRAAGIEPKPGFVDGVVNHVLSGSPETFHWDDVNNVDSDITLSISEEDVADVEGSISRFLESLPNIVEKVSTEIAGTLLKSLKQRWAEEHSLQEQDRRSFCIQLEKRWGKALGMLRMLLTISRELGDEIVKLRSPDKSPLSNVLFRLHIRACQITAEIITLLENGYADGAMARWRTLHEISIVMVLISEHGEPLAERYIAHRAVEAKSGKDQYALCYEQLGYQQLSPAECREIDEAYDHAIRTYGKEFGGPYGWAAGYVSTGTRGRIGLGELEAAAGRAMMASHYKLASYNVHAGPHALFFRLGLLDDKPGILAGASNVGLTEPGQNTAVSFSLISILLVGDSVNLDTVVTMKILQLVRDQIPPSFSKAERKLQNDHMRYSRAKRV